MITYFLVEELVRRGHEVTLFASSDSETSARLVSICDSQTVNLRDGPQELFLPYQLLLSKMIVEQSHQFDLIHDNYFETFLLSSFFPFSHCPIVHTIHNDFFHFKKLKEAMLKIDNQDFYVFISQNAFKAASEVKNKTFIYNGIDIKLFPFDKTPDDYFVWLGRLASKKGAREAIEAALEADVNLRVAAAIDTPAKQEYFDKEIKPLLGAKIKFEGELDFQKKIGLLQKAKALIAPIQWEEPFGLVMVEAMACGTPVVAFNRGAAPEIVRNGETGFVVKEGDIKGLVAAIHKINKIERENCRKYIEENFTIEKMVNAYEELYRKILGKITI